MKRKNKRSVKIMGKIMAIVKMPDAPEVEG